MESRYWPGKDFTPTIYNGDVVVFRVDEQFFYRPNDESLGWSQRVRGSVEIVRIPGNHFHVLREPGVSVVAREIEAKIDKYLSLNTGYMHSKIQEQ
jgi:thioesterase domain-containing protein